MTTAGSRLGRAALRLAAEATALRRRLVPVGPAVRPEDVARLRSAIDGLPPLPAPASDAEANWFAYRRRFRQDVRARDPRRFLRWPVLRPMYKRDAPYLASWLAHLRARPDWASRWRPAVAESAIGDPRPFLEYRASSGNMLSQAYHVCQLEEVTGARLAEADFILEFGGGYGALCRLVWALGFRGTYAIYDFPEFTALQEFYLRAHGLPVTAADGRPGVVTLSTLGELDGLLAGRRPGRAALCALWSLSESPLSLREAIVERTAGFDLFVFAYQPTFEDIDNVAWFGALGRRLDAGIAWHELPIRPHRESMRYRFGVRGDRRGA